MEFDVKNQLYSGLDVQPRLASQIITGGQLGVDTFFFLSGFLSSYVGLKKLRDGMPMLKVERAPPPHRVSRQHHDVPCRVV